MRWDAYIVQSEMVGETVSCAGSHHVPLQQQLSKAKAPVMVAVEQVKYR